LAAPKNQEAAELTLRPLGDVEDLSENNLSTSVKVSDE